MFTTSLLKTDFRFSNRFSLVAILLLLIISLVSLFIAPLLMPQDYSWVSNAISDSAAQGVQGAWLGRFGLLIYGLAIIWLANSLYGSWGAGARYCHFFFGIFMVSAAAFSIRPWQPELPFDAAEDFLHSFTATAMGFAYTFGVILIFLQRSKTEAGARMFDLFAAAVATVLPLIMLFMADIHGLVQRIMFLVSYLWYAREVFRLR